MPSRPSTLPKTLSKDDRKALMRVPNLDRPTGLRNRVLLETMYGLGLRVSETCGLHVRDVHWSESKLHLRPEITKFNVEAWLTLPPSVEDWIRRWIPVRREYAAGKPHLFTTLQGGPLDRRYVWDMVNRYSRRAGIGHVSPHMLRHTYATDLLADDFNLVEVKELLRHADVRTTTIYTHIHQPALHRKIRQRRAA